MKDLGPRLVGISDVSLGYGSPQLPALMGSLLNHYAPAQAWILEPDQSERPARHDLFPEIHFRRLNTRFSPFTMGGMIEYNLRAVRLLEELAPDLVVVTSSATLPALLLLKNKPRVVIYYMLESLAYYAKNASPIGRLMMTLNRQAGPLLDLIIVPEENRAVLDVPRARFHGVPLVVAYNVVHSAASARQVVPAEERSPTLFYSGTIQRGETYLEYFLEPEVADVPIDLYGLVEGEDKVEMLRQLLSGVGRVSYRGYVDAKTLQNIRRSYAYSIVMWAPTNEHQLYAAPNKFFDAIADGVPPLTAPHPQCKMLVNRYQCGIVLRDWTFDSFREGAAKALKLVGTPVYAQMVENCRRAVLTELNWEAQFRKIQKCLPERLAA